MSSVQPVRIIGGGLAGLSLGIALGEAGVPAEIYEAGDYPRHRVCGEFVTGLDETTLRKLGIGAAFAGAGCLRTVTWFLGDRAVARQQLPAPARALSRFALDARLAQQFVAGGGILHRNHRQPAPAETAGWVDAGGRKTCGASPWIGLKLHARELATTDDLELHLGDGGYVGLSAVEDGWINVCGLFRRRPGLQLDRGRALSGYLRACGLDGLAGRLATAHIQPGSATAVAGLACSRRSAAGAGIRLGDAGAMIPPFTGNGMAMAFIGAALALDPLVAWARQERSWASIETEIQTDLRRKFRLRLGAAALLHPFFLKRPLSICLGAAGRAGLIPFNPLYQLLH